MKLEFINQTNKRIPKIYLIKWCKLLAGKLSRRGWLELSDKTLCVVFLSEPEMERVNYRFRRKKHATDVLSFEGLDPESLGEVLLCPKVIARQASSHGLSFRDEVAYLVLHGILHLLGFEHEKGGAQARKMYALQDELFREIDKIS